MNRVQNYDYLILGAGLAGVSVADKLLKRNKSVLLIDKQGIGFGASGTPLGLVNPATGRFATLSENAELLYDGIFKKLSEVQEVNPNHFFKKSGVLRPATDAKIAEKMRSNYENTTWPSDWCKWLDEKEIRDLEPQIKCVEGGLWLPIGISVNVKEYLLTYVSNLKKKGLETNFDGDLSIEKSLSDWSVRNNEFQFSAANLIVTSGYESSLFPFWKELKIHAVKGELAVYEHNNDFPFDFAVSALGYISSIDKKRFVIGSTYDHRFEDLNPTEKGLNYLETRCAAVLPDLLKSAKLIERWSGVRASTPNRKPIIGMHPKDNSVSIFAGLGSKGLLYSEYYAGKLVRHLLEDEKIEKEYSVTKFFPD